MKCFVFALILLALMLCGITLNALYINNVAKSLLLRIDRLPSMGEAGCAEAISALCEDWSAKEAFVGLSVGFPVTDKLSEQAAVLLACASCGDLYGYQTALVLLRDAVGDMSRLERLSIENLF